jgi:hypothetical protein
LLTGTTELLLTGGVSPKKSGRLGLSTVSKRNRGLKQGLFIFLLTFLVVPIISIITVAVRAEPFAVAISAIILFMGGLLRMAYALMFESNESLATPTPPANFAEPSMLRSGVGEHNNLPPMPAAAFVPPGAGRWRETNDLEPTSVVEGTTQLLSSEEETQ